jgi:phage baseplate assembly protein W
VASVPHLATPFRIVNGAIAVVEQDSVEEIEDCVESILRTFVGTRIDAPDFGIPDETFRQQTPSTGAELYIAAIEAQEPRAHVLGRARLTQLAEKHVTIESAVSATASTPRTWSR